MVRQRQIYQGLNGRSPFEDWIEDLKDFAGRAKIKVRLDRAAQGNFGDYRSVGSGIIELRVHEGPGYRIYIGLPDESSLVSFVAAIKVPNNGILIERMSTGRIIGDANESF